jgi:hypothetical protein
MAPLSGDEERSSLICFRAEFLKDLFLKSFDESNYCSKQGRFWSYKSVHEEKKKSPKNN